MANQVFVPIKILDLPEVKAAMERINEELDIMQKKNDHEIRLLQLESDIYKGALEAIRGPMDDPTGLDWRMTAYRTAGGGYEGLQQIAEVALREGSKAHQNRNKITNE